MSVTFTGPSHSITAEREKVRLTERHSEDRTEMILGVAVGLLVWATIAVMAIYALARL